MKKAILGKKIGMTQIFTEDGNLIPVTVIEAGPCPVVQKKTDDVDDYTAVQVGLWIRRKRDQTNLKRDTLLRQTFPLNVILKNLSLTTLLSLMSAMYSVLTSLQTMTFLMLPEQVKVMVCRHNQEMGHSQRSYGSRQSLSQRPRFFGCLL